MGENADESDTEVGKPFLEGRPAVEHCLESGFQKKNGSIKFARLC